MNQIPANFGNKTKCETGCGQNLTNDHIIKCSILNEGLKHELDINGILNGSLMEKIQVLRKFQQNMEKREKYLNDLCDSV